MLGSAQATAAPSVVICPIRCDGGARREDHKLWVELRRTLAGSPTHLVGFISVSGRSYWIDEFNPLPAFSETAKAHR